MLVPLQGQKIYNIKLNLTSSLKIKTKYMTQYLFILSLFLTFQNFCNPTIHTTKLIHLSYANKARLIIYRVICPSNKF